MACPSCEFKGYIETFRAYGGQYRPTVNQCTTCWDVIAYQERLSRPADAEPVAVKIKPSERPLAKVYEFQKRVDKPKDAG